MLVPVNPPKVEKVIEKEDDFLSEIEQKIKENKAEIHEIDTSIVPELEKISESTFNAICNPGVYAFREGLSELNRLQNDKSIENCVELQLGVLDQIHMVLLMGNEQLNLKIIEMLPEFCIFLENPALYAGVCTILCDISHMNKNVINSLIKYEIFEKLDYSQRCSFSLTFSICDQNKEAWDAFCPFIKPHFRENQYVKMLYEQYE